MPANEKMEAVLKSLDKAYTGPLYSLKDWDVRVIPKTVKAILQKYRLSKTYDQNNPVNCDDELADTFFKAGYELALELGFYCEDTERVIKVTEDEIRVALAKAPKSVTFGAGKDEVIMRPRRPEDPVLPVVIGPLALMMDDQYVVGTLAGVAKHRELVDILNCLTINQPADRAVRAGTPYETWLGYYEQQLKRQALELAGRPEMATCSVGNSVTEYGHLGGAWAAPGKNNLSLSLLPSEMKITFANFHRAINAYNLGHSLHAGGNSYIGGYVGPVEGAVLATIANDFLLSTILRTDLTSGCVFDIHSLCNTVPKGLWGNSVATQAITRNTRIMTDRIVNTLNGPMTRELFYESAVGMMTFAVSGTTETIVPRSAGGRYVNHVSPVEAWWSAQVFKSCADMSRRQANEIAQKLLPRYLESIAQPLKGRPGYELFNYSTLEPIEEYAQMYKEVEKELIELGMPLERFSIF
ncbi:MAG: monomethylamine:corrinoid methyltransferase [Bacillota bacterium]